MKEGCTECDVDAARALALRHLRPSSPVTFDLKHSTAAPIHTRVKSTTGPTVSPLRCSLQHMQPSNTSDATAGASPCTDTAPKQHRAQMKKVFTKLRTCCKKRDTHMTMAGCFVTGTMTADSRLEVLKQLRQRIQPDQRTDEWYAQRDRLITASDFGTLLKSESTRTNYALGKAEAIRNPRTAAERRTNRPVGAACRHGILFEPVCDLVYRTICRPGTDTSEFGLLVHPHTDRQFLGASPDGICTENGGDPETQTGRLVEYKAPISRKIVHGRVPEKYLAQIQGQLEVTGLCECDYLECAFRFQTHEEALQRASITKDIDRKMSGAGVVAHGVMLEFPTSLNREPVLGSVNQVDDACVEGLLGGLENDEAREAVFVRYWVLEDYQLVTVKRNRAHFEHHMLPYLQDTWTKIKRFVADQEAFDKATSERAERAKKRSSGSTARGNAKVC